MLELGLVHRLGRALGTTLGLGTWSWDNVKIENWGGEGGGVWKWCKDLHQDKEEMKEIWNLC